MSRETIILTTLISYQVTLVLIGLWASRRTHDNDDFFLGGRQLGATVASISYAASSSSVWVLIGFTGVVYLLGLKAFWFVPCITLGHYLSWRFIAPRLMTLSREQRLVTLTDLLAGDARGGIRGAIVISAAMMVLVSFAFYVASQFAGAGQTFSESFNISFANSVYLGAGVILIYTLLGGFWAVSVTDTLQGLLMVGVAVLLPIAALVVVGGPGDLYAGLEGRLAEPQLALFGLETGPFVAFFVGVAGLAIGAFGQPQLLNRFMALRDERALVQGRRIATIWFAFIFSSMFIVGLSGHVLSAPLDDHESVFFVATEGLLPTVLAGIVTAGVLSAIMSTADSQLLVAASAVSHDLRLEKRFGISPIMVSRIVIVLLCAASVWITFALPSDIFSRVVFAWSALGCAFGPTVIARVADIDTRPGAVLVAILVGFSLTVFFNIYFQTAGTDFAFMPPEMGGVFERILPFVLGLAILFGSQRRTGPVTARAPAE